MAHESFHRARVYVLTVSDTRTVDDDEDMRVCQELLQGTGHEIVGYELVPNQEALLREKCRGLCAAGGVDAILICGGTGLSSKDVSVAAVAPLFHRTIDGFGELFRMLSYQEIGARALASRTMAGVCEKTLVFVLPGSSHGVRLALEKLIVPVLGHLCGEVRR